MDKKQEEKKLIIHNNLPSMYNCLPFMSNKLVEVAKENPDNVLFQYLKYVLADYLLLDEDKDVRHYSIQVKNELEKKYSITSKCIRDNAIKLFNLVMDCFRKPNIKTRMDYINYVIETSEILIDEKDNYYNSYIFLGDLIGMYLSKYKVSMLYLFE